MSDLPTRNELLAAYGGVHVDTDWDDQYGGSRGELVEVWLFPVKKVGKTALGSFAKLPIEIPSEWNDTPSIGIASVWVADDE